MNQVDITILTEINLKQIIKTTDIIISKIKKLGRETICFYIDSKVHNTEN